MLLYQVKLSTLVKIDGGQLYCASIAARVSARSLFFVLFLILNVNVQVSLGKNSVVTVVEGSPTAEWWRVETDQGVQVSVVRIKINTIEILDAI